MQVDANRRVICCSQIVPGNFLVFETGFLVLISNRPTCAFGIALQHLILLSSMFPG